MHLNSLIDHFNTILIFKKEGPLVMRTIGGVQIPNPKSDAEIQSMIDNSTENNYKAQGSIHFVDLPTPGISYSGFAYDILDDFTTDERFTEGAGKDYKAGTNIVVVKVEPGVYKYDVFASVDSDTVLDAATEEDMKNLMNGIFND